MKPNIFDKLARFIAPGLAVKRLENKARFDNIVHRAQGTQTIGTSYDASVSMRVREYPAFRRSFEGDEDRAVSGYERRAMRLNIREMRRNVGLVFGALQRFADGVVGSGIMPLPNTPDAKFNEEAAQLWSDYMNVCDYRQRLKGREIMRLVIKARMAEGHCGLVKVRNGQIQPIEAERIKTPTAKMPDEGEKIIDGFSITPSGIPRGVYVCKRSKTGRVDNQDYQFVRWRDFMHPCVVERFDQLHGVPSLASVCNQLRDKHEYTLATLIKAKLDAFQAWAIMSDEDLLADIDNATDREATITETSNEVRVQKHDYGQTWYLPEGSKMESLASKTPNAQYDPFTRSILHEIGMALGIPYEVLMLDLARVSFAGGRGIMQLAYTTWDIWRAWLVDEFLQPWWNWRVAMAIKSGVIRPAPTDARGKSLWHKVQWQAPARTWLDPKGEATANKSSVELGTTSVARIALSQGTTEDDIFREKEASIEKAAAAAERINKKYPHANATWRDITNPHSPIVHSKGVPEADSPEDEDEDEEAAAAVEQEGSNQE